MLKRMLSQLAGVFRSLPILKRRSRPEPIWTRDRELAIEMTDRAQFVADRYPIPNRSHRDKQMKARRRTRDLTRAMHQHQRRVGSA